MFLSSIRSLKTGSLLLATLAAASLPAFAGDTTVTTTSSKDKNPVIEKPPTEPRFWVDLSAGGEFDIHATKFISDGSAYFFAPLAAAPIVGVPVVDRAHPQALVAANGGLLGTSIQSRDFESSHDVGVINGRLELGYKVLPFLSVFVGGTYSHSNGNNSRAVGGIADYDGAFGAVGGRYDLFADVGRYEAYAGMAGIKLNTPRTLLDLLHIPRAIRPYASLSLGGKYVENQNVSFYSGAELGNPAGSIVDSGRVRLYDSSWVLTAEAQLGYELQLTRNFSVTLESGYGYDTQPERATLPVNFTGINKGGDRLYSTVSLGAKLTF